MTKQTVTINGVVYDTHTGMPIIEPVTKKTAAVTSSPSVSTTPTATHPVDPHRSQTVHRVTQKSQTLNRRVVKKTPNVRTQINHRPTVSHSTSMDIKKSPSITKFAPHPAGAKVAAAHRPMSDIGPMQHPMVKKANAHVQQKEAAQKTVIAPKPSHIIKQEAISEALAKAPSHSANTKQHETRTKRYPRILSVATASLALLLLGGYFTYLNMPSLSVRVAAAQAGVNATYPEYRPDGYSLTGPVAYTQGEVSMKFAANAGPQNFTVTQEKSSWDSSAVLDNYVKQKAGDNYITYSEHGLTIYTFNGNAAWVNGGILYKIDGNAPLSSDQVRHIATSM